MEGTRALAFNGEDSFVSIQPLVGIDGSSLTVAAWIKLYSLNNTYLGIISLSQVSLAGAGQGYSGDKQGRIGFYVVPEGRSRTAHDPEVFTSPIALHQWHHITAVYTTTGKIKIFLDGQLQSNGWPDQWSSPINFGTPTSVTIGAVSAQTRPDHHFHGLISHVTVWRTALTDEEVGYLPGLNFSKLPKSQLVIHFVGMNGQTLPNAELKNTNWVMCNDFRQIASDPTTSIAIVEREALSVVDIPFSEIKIGKVLGEGGFGIVYVAEWQQTTYAVKRLKNHDHDAWKEAHVLASLKHPSIVSLVGLTTDPNTAQLMLVMEYYKDGSLESLLKSGGINLTRDNVIQIALDIAEGLKFLHEQKIIHRDLKSANVLLYNKTRAKLSDFGTARILSDSFSQPVTVAGSLGFIAPEILAEKPYNSKADVYSFGVVILHMMTKKVLPVITDSLARRVRADVWDPFLQNLIIDCCKTNPTQRPSIQECIVRLKANQHEDEDK